MYNRLLHLDLKTLGYHPRVLSNQPRPSRILKKQGKHFSSKAILSRSIIHKGKHSLLHMVFSFTELCLVKLSTYHTIFDDFILAMSDDFVLDAKNLHIYSGVVHFHLLLYMGCNHHRWNQPSMTRTM